MNRREFITLLGASGAAWPMIGNAQQALRRIGMLETTSQAQNATNLSALRDSLFALGYVEGKNYVIEYRSSGQAERFPPLAQELLNIGVDVIVTRGTPATIAARNATSTIPIVMAATAEPFAVVKSIARPEGNITGFSSLVAELASKRIEVLRDMLPRLERVALMNDGRNPTLSTTRRAAENATRTLKIEILMFDVRQAEDFRPAFMEANARKVDAISMGTEAVTQTNRELVTALAAEHRIPVIYSSKEFVDAGGLIALSVNYQEHYRRVGIYVDRLFKGTKPSELPIEQPSMFTFVINLRAARALGITVPPTLLARADEVIE